MEKILMMNSKDNVAISLNELSAGDEVQVSMKRGSNLNKLVLTSDVPFAHKVALTDIVEGELIIKYGEIIGRATQNIAKGEWVHIHNVESTRARGDKNVD